MPDRHYPADDLALAEQDGARTVGRAGELRAISALFDRQADGSGSFLQIVGEPGIGKTHLLTAVREMALERGVEVLSGRAGEFEQRMPFQVLIEALHDRVAGEGLQRLVPGSADMLTPLIAEPWGVARPGSQPGRDVDFDRFRLFQALRALLVALAVKPLVVMLDDVHWADPGSVDFLSFLSRHPITVPLLVVVSHRDRQAPAQLRYALASNSGYGAVARIDLGPLSRAEAAALIRRRASSRTMEELYQESQGNPLYLLTLDRRVAAAGRGDGGPVWRAGDVSSRLESLILGEIVALSPQEATVASAAAVIGDPFSADLLAGVAELDESEVFASLRRLVDRDLIRSGTSGPALAFRHPLVRSVVYNRTDPVWRMGAHRRSLSRLTALGAPAAARAHHIEHGAAGWTEEHAAVLEQAADESMSTSPLSAAHWFSVELGLLPKTAAFAARRFETSSRLARALCLGGRFVESRNLLHKILHDAPAHAAIDRSAAVVLCAHADQRLGRYAEAIALLRQETDRLGDQDAPAQRVSLCLELGLTAVLANDYAAARPGITWALDAARASGDVLGEATALAFGAFGEICTGRADLARQGATEAARLVDGLPDTELVDEREALSMLGWAEILLERFADAERHLARGRAIIRRTGQSHGLPHVQLGQCLVSMFTGRMSEALERAEDAEDAAHLVGSDHLLGIVLAIKAPILVWVSPRGEGAAALSAARRASALYSGGAADSWWARTVLLARGHAELTNGDPRTCVDLLLKGGGTDLRQLGAALHAQYAEILVGALIKLGEVRRAEAYAREAVQFAQRLGLAGQRAHAARALGLVLAVDGDHASAQHEFRQAGQWFDEAGKTVEQARTAVFAARTLARLGRTAEALPMLERARGQAEACDALWVRDELARVQEQLTVKADSAGVSPVPGDCGPLAQLTGREREVARLVERGRTNRQIAGVLRLSERTVESHLANVYRKLGVPTRAALAAVLGAAVARGGSAGA